MAHATRLVLHHAGRLGVLLVTAALFAAFVVGWLLGNILQLLSVVAKTKGGGHDVIRMRMAQEAEQHWKMYDDVLLHGRVT